MRPEKNSFITGIFQIKKESSNLKRNHQISTIFVKDCGYPVVEYQIRLNWKMNQEEKRVFLIEELKKESSVMRGIAVPKEEEAQKMLLRGLMNVRMAKPASLSFQKVQDEYLQTETENKGITKLSSLSPVAVIPRAAAPDTDSPQGEEVAPASDSEHLRGDEAADSSGSEQHTDAFLYLWQGDITTLAADAIVNAANSAMTGCYIPNHRCIDNAIHTFAGVQLRLYCHTYMQEQAGKKGASYAEPTGQAMLSPAYNLPSKFILHTVGPIVGDALTEEDCKLLASCYTSCLNLASQHQLESIAFCCISTGEFHFPNDRAAEIAIRTVRDWLSGHPSSTVTKVIFNVFKNEDLAIYRSLLHKT